MHVTFSSLSDFLVIARVHDCCWSFELHHRNLSMTAEQTTSFSASGEDAITRTIDISEEDVGPSTAGFEFTDYYEIERTAQELVKGGYKRVCAFLSLYFYTRKCPFNLRRSD
jgi:hypothetical protein